MTDKKKEEEETWLDDEPPSIREKLVEMDQNDGKPYGELELPRTTQRLKLKEDEVVLIPNHVLYDRVEAREIEETDSGSDPDEDELDFMEQEGEEGETRRESTAELLVNMIDIDGRTTGKESVFETYEKASDFEQMRIEGQQAELLCRVLFDYHGGYSLLDLDVIGGQTVMLCAEEYETFLLGRETDKYWVQKGMPTGFLRGQRYSLIRSRESTLTSSLGLIPSFYLVSEAFYRANPYVFMDPSWYLGLCSYDQAVDFLLMDHNAMTEGLFVIFSPRWLNLNPAEPRPFILLMLSHRSEISMKAFRKMGKEAHTGLPRCEELERLGKRTDVALAQQMVGKEMDRIEKNPDKGTIAKKKDIDRRETGPKTGDGRLRAGEKSAVKKQSGACDQKAEPSLEQFAELAALPFAVLPFTIKRSYLGDFELFGERYPTLYHLVLYLSSNRSELPYKLVVGQFVRPPPFSVVPMDPPLRQFKRSPAALPMMVEQWATKHYVSVAEPFYQSSLMHYVVRSLVNPAKALFKKLTTAYVAPKEIKDELAKKSKIHLPPDEHSLHFDPAIVIEPNQIAADEMVQLGAGNFGQAYKSSIVTKKGEKLPVVIKKFPVKQTNPDKMLAFVQEAEAVSSICHVNIAKFYGLTTAKFKEENFLDEPMFPQAVAGANGVVGCVLLIFEMCEGKDLQSFLQQDNNSPGEDNTKSEATENFSTNCLLDFLTQIARALAYLHTRSPAIVHGDVSARNIMVTRHPRDYGRYVLKLIDFGLAKFCRADMNTHYDSQAMPAPWLPLETLKNGELSVTVDFWSFGCVIWEMFGGGTPWGVSTPLHRGIGVAGQYLAKPDSCPDFLYNLMLMCHRPQPHDRITMIEAEQYLLDHWIENEGSYLAEALRGNVR